jgi:hypothetical protein
MAKEKRGGAGVFFFSLSTTPSYPKRKAERRKNQIPTGRPDQF